LESSIEKVLKIEEIAVAKKNTETNEELVEKARNNWFFGLVICAGLFCLAVIVFIL